MGKIIQCKDGVLNYDNEKLFEILKSNSTSSLKNDTPIAILAVLGPPQSGKSFMTNLAIHLLSNLDSGDGGWIEKLINNESFEKGFHVDSISSSQNLIESNESEVYLWPEPYVMTKANGDEIIIWILHYNISKNDKLDSCEKDIDAIESLLGLTCSRILEINDEKPEFRLGRIRRNLIEKIGTSIPICDSVVVFLQSNNSSSRKVFQGKEDILKLLKSSEKDSDLDESMLDEFLHLNLTRMKKISETLQLHDKDGRFNKEVMKNIAVSFKTTINSFLEEDEILPKKTKNGTRLTVSTMSEFLEDCVNQINIINVIQIPELEEDQRLPSKEDNCSRLDPEAKKDDTEKEKENESTTKIESFDNKMDSPSKENNSDSHTMIRPTLTRSQTEPEPGAPTINVKKIAKMFNNASANAVAVVAPSIRRTISQDNAGLNRRDPKWRSTWSGAEVLQSNASAESTENIATEQLNKQLKGIEAFATSLINRTMLKFALDWIETDLTLENIHSFTESPMYKQRFQEILDTMDRKGIEPEIWENFVKKCSQNCNSFISSAFEAANEFNLRLKKQLDLYDTLTSNKSEEFATQIFDELMETLTDYDSQTLQLTSKAIDKIKEIYKIKNDEALKEPEEEAKHGTSVNSAQSGDPAMASIEIPVPRPKPKPRQKAKEASLIFKLSYSDITMSTNIGDVFKVLENPFGEKSTPAIVGINSNGDLVYGSDAMAQCKNNDPPLEHWWLTDYLGTSAFVTIHNVTTRIGKNKLSYDVSVEFLFGYLLHCLKKHAEQLMKTNFTSAIMTIPFWFTSAHRVQVKDAMKIAGFNSTQLVNEESAAAFACAKKKDISGMNVLVLSENYGVISALLYSSTKTKPTRVTMEAHSECNIRKDFKNKIGTNFRTMDPSKIEINLRIKIVKKVCATLFKQCKNSNFKDFVLLSKDSNWVQAFQDVVMELNKDIGRSPDGDIENDEYYAGMEGVSLMKEPEHLTLCLRDSVFLDVFKETGESKGLPTMAISKEDMSSLRQRPLTTSLDVHGKDVAFYQINVLDGKRICLGRLNIGPQIDSKNYYFRINLTVDIEAIVTLAGVTRISKNQREQLELEPDSFQWNTTNINDEGKKCMAEIITNLMGENQSVTDKNDGDDVPKQEANEEDNETGSTDATVDFEPNQKDDQKEDSHDQLNDTSLDLDTQKDIKDEVSDRNEEANDEKLEEMKALLKGLCDEMEKGAAEGTFSFKTKLREEIFLKKINKARKVIQSPESDLESIQKELEKLNEMKAKHSSHE